MWMSSKYLSLPEELFCRPHLSQWPVYCMFSSQACAATSLFMSPILTAFMFFDSTCFIKATSCFLYTAPRLHSLGMVFFTEQFLWGCGVIWTLPLHLEFGVHTLSSHWPHSRWSSLGFLSSCSSFPEELALAACFRDLPRICLMNDVG